MNSGLLAKWRLLLHAASLPQLSRGDLAVLAHICERFNAKAGAAWPALRTLANEAGLSQQGIIDSTRRLQAAGLLGVRPGRGRASNRYMPNFDAAGNAQADLSATVESERRSAQVQDAVVLKCTGRSAQADLSRTHLEPGENRVLRGGAREREADALSRAARVAPPTEACAAAWRELQAARPKLDFDRLATAAQVHYLRPGLPAEALNRALAALAATPQWSALPLPEKGASKARKPTRRQAAATAGAGADFESPERLALYEVNPWGSA